MFESISSKIEKALHTLRGKGSITDINIAETVKEVRKALLDADVSYPIAKEFTDKVKSEALGRNVIQSIEPGQLMVKIVHEKLTELMGSQAVDINTKGSPAVILIAGLQGSGKTTFSAKLAYYLKNKKNKSVMLVAGDVYRPAAISQLQTLGQQIQVPVFTEEGNTNPVDIATKAIKDARLKGTNIVIVDTAGRLAVDEEMMDEISRLKSTLNPQETLFVVDSMTGQDAVNTAKAFNDRLDFDGVVLTKLDGDTRGGAALTIRYTVQKPIKFVGIGEKMDALDVFHPDRMASRILGMGDVLTLIEKAEQSFDEKKALEAAEKLRANRFTLSDYLEQMGQLKNMGDLESLAAMIPGMDSKALKGAKVDEKGMAHQEAIILSMTQAERDNPAMLNSSRKKRIAAGSGTSVVEVNRLLKQFEAMQQMVKQFSGKNMRKLQKKMGRMGGMGGLGGGFPGF